MTSNVSTYKALLKTIQKFEIDEERFRRRRFYWCLLLFFLIIGIFLWYAFKHDFSTDKILSAFVEPDLYKIALSPIFCFLFASYEKSYIDKRRAQLISAIIENFSNEELEPPKFVNEPIKFDEVKAIIFKILNDKL
jgi:hypothetical protein